jgi:hypothetical protein
VGEYSYVATSLEQKSLTRRRLMSSRHGHGQACGQHRHVDRP